MDYFSITSAIIIFAILLAKPFGIDLDTDATQLSAFLMVPTVFDKTYHFLKAA